MEEIYNKKCEQNPLIRDVQAEFEEWRTKWNDYVLYVTGARQTGKTTELLKFAYKHYEQIIYVNLANERQLKSFEEISLAVLFMTIMNWILCLLTGMTENME